MTTRLSRLLKGIILAASLCLAGSSGYGESADIGALDRTPDPVVSKGTVNAEETTDTYRFDLESQCNVNLLLEGLSGNASLQLQTADGQVLASSSKKKKQSETIKELLQPGEYHAVILWADSRPVEYTLQASAEFVIDDIVVTGTFSVQDPEYDASTMKVAWRDGATLRAADIDPDTGLYNMDGQEVVDTGLATDVVNGPEWASTLGGTPRIVYTKSGSDGWSISQAREIADGILQASDISPALSDVARSAMLQKWLPEPVPDTFNGYKPVGSQDGDDASPLMKFSIGTAEDREQANAWKELDSPYDGGLLPTGALGGRFVPGKFSILYSRDSGGFQQLVWYDLRTLEEAILTDTPIHKFLPFAINAPEFGGDVVITAPEAKNSEERGYFDSIGVYREVDGAWTLIKRITSPVEALRGVHSAEPFVFDGRSYVSFLVLKAVDRESNDRKEKAEVWIASLDPEDNLLRKVSGKARIKRSDPESLVTEDEVFIYYTEIAKNTYKQHRARTGLLKR